MSDNGKSMALVPRSMDEMQSLAKLLALSALLPAALRGKPEDVFVTIAAGMELGLPPMVALRSIHVVQGKPVLSADLMVALAERHPECESFACVESTDKIATYSAKRRGHPAVRRSFTWADAERARLIGKDNWKHYPHAMLRARCKADLARDVFADSLVGCYDPDEIDERPLTPLPMPDVQTAVSPEAIDAVIVSETPEADTGNRPGNRPSAEAVAAVATLVLADTIGQLLKLRAQYQHFTGAARRAVADAFKQRQRELRAEEKLASAEPPDRLPPPAEALPQWAGGDVPDVKP